jgi:hypothetical protein
LYDHLVDCYLCCSLTYLKMEQQFDEVQRLMNSVLDIDPNNLPALLLKFESYIHTLNYEKCHQSYDLIIKIMSQSCILRQSIVLNSESDSSGLELNETNLKKLHSSALITERKFSEKSNKVKRGITPVNSNSTNITETYSSAKHIEEIKFKE